jgi:tRNA pseudouridine38-40 synthase
MSVLAVRRPIDVPAMAAAARLLVGEHDFGSFCRPRPGATAVRDVLACSWQRDEDGLAVLDIRADAFCHSMVRSIVGACLAIGTGQHPPHWVAELLAARSRERAAPVAPAHGLVLTEVGYPPPAAFPAQVARARRQRPPLATDPPGSSLGTSG